MEYVYAALLLHKLGKEINEENLKKVIEATGTAIDESKLRSLVASLKGIDITKALEESARLKTEVEVKEKKEEKKEEKREEVKEAAEGLSALFG